MLDALVGLIMGRRVVPVAPVRFVPCLPELDEDEGGGHDYAPDLESVGGVGCIITYADSKGDVSVRRITCRKLSHKGSVSYLQAFCHEREALRTFRISRIAEVACGVTGEVFVPASAFFARYSFVSEGGAAVGFGLNVRLAADLRAALNVLAFLARVDGRVVPEESEMIEGFCRSFGMRYASDDFDFEGTCRYACRLAPDAETFYVSLGRLKRDGAPEGLSRLTSLWAGQLIEADGVQDPKEVYFAVQLQQYLTS